MVRHNLMGIDADLVSRNYYTPSVTHSMVEMEGKTYTISEVDRTSGIYIYRLEGFSLSFIDQYLEFVSSSIDTIIENVASYDELSSFLK